MFSFNGCTWKRNKITLIGLGHAIHVSLSCQFDFSDAGGGWAAFLLWCDGTCGLKPGHPGTRFAEVVVSPLCPAVAPPCNNLLQSLSLTWDAGGGVHQGWGGRAPGRKSHLPCSTNVGNYEFISMSFCLLGICTTHVVSVCFIYLWFEIPCLKEKGKEPV